MYEIDKAQTTSHSAQSTGVWNADTSTAELASPSLLGDSGSEACNTYFLCKVLIGQVYDITERG